MKLFLDLPTRQFVRSAASSAPLPRTFFKRRDKAQIEIVFVEKAAAVPIPAGTTFLTGLKTGFGATEFLALTDSTGLLDLYTEAVEELFANEPDTVTALLEVKTTAPGEETRTATLAVDLQNSVILGDEGVPASAPSLKASSAEAAAGEANDKWMTPLRTFEAIAAFGNEGAGLSWSSITGKPSTFTPSSHTHAQADITGLTTALAGKQPLGNYAAATHEHTAAQIVDFATAVGAVAPAASWENLSGKPETFPATAHTHTITQVEGLAESLATKQPAGAYAAASHTHDASAITSGQISIDRLPVLPSQVPVVVDGTLADVLPAQESEILAGTVVITADGERYVYKGTGAKTSPASYIILADITPTWASITSKPATFAPSAHTHGTTEVAYNTTISDSVVSVAVGGAPAAPASAWKTKTVAQVLDDILFPTIAASVASAKSLSLSVSGSAGTLEIGSTISRTLTATLSRGTIRNGDGTTNANPLVGAATSHTFSGPGISSTQAEGTTASFSAIVASGANTWSVTAAHGAGSGQYFDNKGTPGTNLDSQRVAATLSASASGVTGVYPFYYLKSSSPITASGMVSAIQSGTATKVVASSTGTLSIPYAPTAQYIAVAYPATSTTKTLYFVTSLDTGAITVLFAPATTLSVTTALWTNQSYKIHTSTAALTNSNPILELRN